MDQKSFLLLLRLQKNEITEEKIYARLAQTSKEKKNQALLKRIAKDEGKHYTKLIAFTGIKLKPNRLRVMFYYLLAKVFGLAFSLRLMEKGESLASKAYQSLGKRNPVLKRLSLDEQRHEKTLLNLLADKRLDYASSIILGLNDALVELTGALAGLTLALQNKQLIAMAALVTGFAASLSMSASSYFSAKEEHPEKNPKKPLLAALVTGLTYLGTVFLLISPYFLPLGDNVFLAFGLSLGLALFIIFFYTFYITTARGLSFWRRFGEMVVISFGIAGLSFGVGLLLKNFLGLAI